MFKTLTPVFALVVAAALFFTYIQPTFENVKETQSEAAEYRDAVDKAEQLRELIDDKLADRNAFAPRDLERLEVMLPDRVDEVGFLMSLDRLASDHGVQLSDIEVETQGDTSIEALTGGTSGRDARSSAENGTHAPFDITFQIRGQYEEFRDFLRSLERSLKLVEVMELNFGEADEEGNVNYQLLIRTFTLTPNN